MTSSVTSLIFAVFTSIGEWIVGAFPQITSLFYSAETGLTFMGVLAVCGLGFSVIFLLMGVIQRFLHFRG